MTFLTDLNEPRSARTVPEFSLSQHGRAAMEFLGAAQRFSSGYLRPLAQADFEAGPEARALGAEHAADVAGTGARTRVAKARALADALPLFRLERFIQRWVAEENFNTGIPAIEEKRANFESFANRPVEATTGGSLELDETLVAPKYWATQWHLEPGGWDGYDLYGPLFAFAVGPLVFSRGGYAAVGVNDDITQQRLQTVRQFPKARYDRIYEPGCGGATTARALHAIFPDAELVGSDLSPSLLRNGHRMAEKLGVKLHLKQRNSVDSREPDASFDGVITYALHHELPPKANAELFDEMFRIMKPGADIVISDPPPFRAVSLFHAVVLDWDTVNREEPFFSIVGLSSLDDQLRDAGFEAVESYAIGQGWYPWITRARKPEASAMQAAAAA